MSLYFRMRGNIRKNLSRAGYIVIVTVLLLSTAGCSHSQRMPDQKTEEEVAIPMILTVDPSTGTKNEEEVVQAFNQEYEGTYRMDVDWILETEEEYRMNLKRLNVTDELPAVITDLRMLPSFYQMMIEEKRIEDLSSYMEADEIWKTEIEPEVLNACMEEDGSIYLGPISTAFFSCSGIFWNEKLFEQAGIQAFPDSWESFWACCEKLRESGIVPLGLHTEGTAWAPLLLATAELAETSEGAAFMEKLYPESYQNASGITLAQTLKKLFVYTTENAMYSDFDVAYENFMSGKVAMVPNGYWMIDQIPQELAEDVRFSPFPGNKLISSPETFGWAVVASYPEEVKKGAVEFLKFRTEFNRKQKNRFLELNQESGSQLLRDYIQAYIQNAQIVPNYQVKWNSILQEETLGEVLPQLIRGQLTEAGFTEKLDESIRQFEEER